MKIDPPSESRPVAEPPSKNVSSDILEHIPLGEVTFSTHPHGDQAGRIFRWNDELYRAIRPDHTTLYQRLFKEGILPRLIERGLFVETMSMPYTLAGYGMIVRHRSIPFVTYPIEWCPPMLRDAAVATLDVEIELLKHQATLNDAHPWNVLFDAHHPVLVDLTAIADDSKDGRWVDEKTFRRYFICPLTLMAHGRLELGQLMLGTDAVNDTDLIKMLPYTISNRVRQWMARMGSRLSTCSEPQRSRKLQAKLRRWREQIVNLPIASTPKRTCDDVATAVARTLQQLGPTTVMTVNCSDQAWPVAFAEQGLRVLACESRPDVCSSLYAHIKAQDLDVLPLHLDIFESTSIFGTFRRTASATAQRLQCDMVVSSDLGPMPTTSEGWVYCDQMIQVLSSFARKWVVIGFRHSKNAGKPTHLTAIFDRQFSYVEPLEIPRSYGQWFVCERSMDQGENGL